jgi:hypothetical protein
VSNALVTFLLRSRLALPLPAMLCLVCGCALLIGTPDPAIARPAGRETLGSNCVFQWHLLGLVETCRPRAWMLRRIWTSGRSGQRLKPKAEWVTRVVVQSDDCVYRYRRDVQRRLPSFQHCYVWEGLTVDPELRTKVTLVFTMFPRHRFAEQVNILLSPRTPVGLVKCLIRAMRTIYFSQPFGSDCDPYPHVILYPLHLSPAEQPVRRRLSGAFAWR